MKGEWKELLLNFLETIKQNRCDTSDGFEKVTTNFLENHEVKLVKLAQPVRIAITGNSTSPSLYDTMSIVGKDELIKRIERLLEVL